MIDRYGKPGEREKERKRDRETERQRDRETEEKGEEYTNMIKQEAVLLGGSEQTQSECEYLHLYVWTEAGLMEDNYAYWDPHPLHRHE